jgi:ubiquinone/menaquinone biosynthesis C-methylase UbiE
MTTDSWGADDNAPRYDAFAREYPVYRQTSRDLVALASAAGSATVIDLACGTGIATEEILAVLGPDGKVIGIDKSPAMLAVAARAVPDPRVRWIQAFAESIDAHVTERVDAVVCNSAIWQTDLPATANAVGRVMAAGGLFVFNVGSGFLEDCDDPNELGELPALVAGIAERDYGWRSPVTEAAPRRRRSRLSRAAISECLTAAGFAVDQTAEFTYEESTESQRAWLSLPIFSQSYLPGLPYEARKAVLDKAFEQLGPGHAAQSRWVAFMARARADV